MQVVNLIIVLNTNMTEVLMCHRKKDPYKGLFNFVGGKVEPEEVHLEAAYRELFEETNISDRDIEIEPLFFSKYPKDKLELQVYYGVLKHDVELIKEDNPLLWVKLDSDFSDSLTYAGDGNIQHMIENIKYYLNL